MLFLNILWAVYIDWSIGSYYNAGCGLILALTVPLPSSVGRGAPGYKVHGEEQHSVFSVPDNHWLWVSVYTTWDFLFALVFTLEVFATACHLLPCYLYSLVNRRWDLWFMVRVSNLWSTHIFLPWRWAESLLGEPLIIKDELVVNIWGAINLFLAVIWTVYYVGFVWRRRTFTDIVKTEIEVKNMSTEIEV